MSSLIFSAFRLAALSFTMVSWILSALSGWVPLASHPTVRDGFGVVSSQDSLLYWKVLSLRGMSVGGSYGVCSSSMTVSGSATVVGFHPGRVFWVSDSCVVSCWGLVFRSFQLKKPFLTFNPSSVASTSGSGTTVGFHLVFSASVSCVLPAFFFSGREAWSLCSFLFVDSVSDYDGMVRGPRGCMSGSS